MKTGEGNKYEKFTQQRNAVQARTKIDEIPEFHDDLNEERIITTHKPRIRNYYYDNSTISMSYGQYNVEKCLVVLFILLVYSAILFYNYSSLVNTLNFVLLISGMGLDLIISVLYLYFLIKLKAEEMFNTIPMRIINSSDVLITIDLVLKIITLIMVGVDYPVLGVSAMTLFAFKFIIEFYFAIISIKLLMFCPCAVYIQEQTEKAWTFVKYYIFCCEVEENDSLDYTKLEDLESFY